MNELSSKKKSLNTILRSATDVKKPIPLTAYVSVILMIIFTSLAVKFKNINIDAHHIIWLTIILCLTLIILVLIGTIVQKRIVDHIPDELDSIEVASGKDEYVKKQKYLGLPKKGKQGILIDVSHNQDAWDENSIMNITKWKNKNISFFNSLSESLIQGNDTNWDFKKIKEIQQFKQKDLDAWIGLIFAIPKHKKICTETCSEIVNWVRKKGGRLLLLGFELGDRHHETNLNDLANEFGFRFNMDIVSSEKRDKSNERTKPYDEKISFEHSIADNHPIMKGIKKLELLNLCTITIDAGNTKILTLNKNNISFLNEFCVKYTNGFFKSGIQEYKVIKETSWIPVITQAPKTLTGKGEVIAIGTWEIFGRNFELLNSDNNNLLFVKNILNWLTYKPI